MGLQRLPSSYQFISVKHLLSDVVAEVTINALPNRNFTELGLFSLEAACCEAASLRHKEKR